MWLAVTEISDQTQAVPAAGEPRGRGLGLDEPDFVGVRLLGVRLLRLHRHADDLTPAAGLMGMNFSVTSLPWTH
jgi:hypothetical protein